MIDVEAHESLAILPDGRPRTTLQCVKLDDWHDAEPAAIERAVAQSLSSVALTIGVANRNPPPKLQRLVEAMTLTVAGPEVDTSAPELVAVSDPQQAYTTLCNVVSRHPQASIALGQLLRQTSRLDMLAGLAAEAAVYSMLLGGTEFAEWLDSGNAPRVAMRPKRQYVHIVRDVAALSVILDDPDRRNAFSFQMREELLAALELAAYDDTIEHVEISGAGPVFCSGGHLTEFGTATDLVAAYLVRLDRAPWRLIDRLRARVTVRLHGAAVGAGIEMAAFGGRVAATSDTAVVLPEIDMGLVPGAGGTVSVPRRIGRWRAAWMMLSGTSIDAVTAHRWGLIDELSEP